MNIGSKPVWAAVAGVGVAWEQRRGWGTKEQDPTVTRDRGLAC